MVFRDKCRRIKRQTCGEYEWLRIPRFKCDNEDCGKIHRMLPDFLAPFKQYEESVIVDAIDGRIDPAENDDRPSRQTARHWKMWLELNREDIDGHMKSIGHRLLGFSEALLRSEASMLDGLRRLLPEGWLKVILRTIYNSGGRLATFYPGGLLPTLISLSAGVPVLSP